MALNFNRLAAAAVILAACAPQSVEQEATYDADPHYGEVTGTVTYLERIALPEDAVVHVRLEEVTEQAAPTIIAAQNIRTEGRQVPIPFDLVYDMAAIQPERRYAVHAEIRVGDGAAGWAADSARHVITHGAPTSAIEILVRRAASAPE